MIHAALLVFLIFVFPVWDAHETRRLKAATDPRARVRSYQKAIAWQLIAVALLLATVPTVRLFTPPWGPERLGIEPSRGLLFGVMLGMVGGMVLPVALALRDPEGRRKQAARLESIWFILPRTREARLWWAALSVTVGVCEEIVFRGWMIPYLEELAPWLGPLGAVLAAAAVFGIDHGYQGWTGVVGTAALALFLTILYLLSGTLWIPIVVHVLVDLRVLFLLGPDHDGHRGPA